MFSELHLLCCSTTKVAQAVTHKLVLVQPAIATAPTQSLAPGMVPPAAHTLLPSPHPPLHTPVAEAQAALLLHRLQLLPMGEQGNFPCQNKRHDVQHGLEQHDFLSWSFTPCLHHELS